MGILEEMSEMFQAHQFTVNPNVLFQHSKDESYHQSILPDIVVYPETTQDVVSLVKYASGHHIPIVPFGAGTSLEGQTVPVQHGISLDLMRMDKVVEVRPDDFLVCVEPGVTRTKLNNILKPFGLFFPVDPGADASIGGMAATNASGTTTVRYGAMRENVRSLEIVLPNGEVIQTSSLAAKSSSGYHLTELFLGSEGTLGVFTKIWLKVYGIPEKTVAARVEFSNISECVRSVTTIIGTGVPVTRIELVDAPFITAFNKFKQTNYKPVPTLLLEFRGNGMGVDFDIQFVKELLHEEGCGQISFVLTEEERNLLWETRHAALYAFMHQYPSCSHMATDVCVPLSKLPEAIEHAHRILNQTGVHGAIIGHVGDGNFHTSLAVNTNDPKEMKNALYVNEQIVHNAIQLGGTCTGEHGVGLGKKKYQDLEHGTAIKLMRELKTLIDPSHIMNPGKLVDK